MNMYAHHIQRQQTLTGNAQNKNYLLLTNPQTDLLYFTWLVILQDSVKSRCQPTDAPKIVLKLGSGLARLLLIKFNPCQY